MTGEYFRIFRYFRYIFFYGRKIRQVNDQWIKTGSLFHLIDLQDSLIVEGISSQSVYCFCGYGNQFTALQH